MRPYTDRPRRRTCPPMTPIRIRRPRAPRRGSETHFHPRP